MAVKARDDITLARVDDGAAGKDGQMLYATCATASATVAKVATLAAGKLTLKAGATVAVRFTYANNAASPTLNVGGTGAKAIYTQGVRYAYWAAGATVIFAYDGTYWRVASEPVYASTATIGNPSAANIYLNGNDISIRKGATVMAKYSGNEINFKDRLLINENGIDIASDNDSAKKIHIRGDRISFTDTNYQGAAADMIMFSAPDDPQDPSSRYSTNIIGLKSDGNPVLAFSDYETALSEESVLINSGARSDLAVTFSKSHDSPPDVILATPFTSTGGGVECAVKNFTKTGFTANMKNGGASAAYFKVCYLAVWF